MIKEAIKGSFESLVRGIKIGLVLIFFVTGLGLVMGGASKIAFPAPKQYQSIKNLPPLELGQASKNSSSKREAMIALFRKDETGKLQFECTAFVVSDKLAITAGHCLEDENRFLIKDEIIVKDISFKETGIRARGAALNLRADMGVIVGDFSKFNKLKMNLIPGGFYETRGPYLACGFAWGSIPALCTQFTPSKNYYFQDQGRGHLFPGMSGGPVIDSDSGQVVGINVSVENGSVVVASTVGIIGALELIVKNP